MSVMNDLDHSQIFDELKDHMTDTGVTENHVFLLTKSVSRNYIKIRMHHLGKNHNERILKNNRMRKKMTKLILFKNQ